MSKIITVPRKKKECFPLFTGFSKLTESSEVVRFAYKEETLNSKGYVPFDEDIDFKAQWFSGVVDASGHCGGTLYLKSKDKMFLKNVKVFLADLNILSFLKSNKKGFSLIIPRTIVDEDFYNGLIGKTRNLKQYFKKGC